MNATKPKSFYRDLIHKRGKTRHFRYQFTADFRVRSSLKTENIEEAIEKAIEIYEQNKDKSRATAETEKSLTLKTLSEKYIENKRQINGRTIKHYKDQEKAVLKILGENYLAHSMNMDEAERLINVFEQSGKKPRTIYHRIRYLKTIYEWAVNRFRDVFPYDKLSAMELPHVPKKNKTQRYSEIIMEDELMDFFYEINEYHAPIAFTSLCTGMLNIEIRNAKRYNVLLQCFGDKVNEFDLTVTKGNDELGSKNRKISIPDCLAEYLQNWIINHEIKTDDFLFPNQLGKIRDEAMKGIKNAFRRIGRSDLVQHHTFRRTWTTYMEKYLDKKYTLDIELMGGWEDNEKAARMLRLYSNSENDIDYLLEREKRVSQVFHFLTPIAWHLIKRDNLSVGKPMEEIRWPHNANPYNLKIIPLEKVG